MKRKIPENTNYFKYYNANPKNNVTCDCVIRAICTAMNKPYDDVLTELFEYSKRQSLMMDDKKLYANYLKDKGWVKLKQLRKWDNKKYTGKELCDELHEGLEIHTVEGYDINENTNIICHIGAHHLTCIINGYVNDTWNSSFGCVGTLWIYGG